MLHNCILILVEQEQNAACGGVWGILKPNLKAEYAACAQVRAPADLVLHTLLLRQRRKQQLSDRNLKSIREQKV
eukprot:5372560-Pleurochrysis_carterae.AAC.2